MTNIRTNLSTYGMKTLEDMLAVILQLTANCSADMHEPDNQGLDMYPIGKGFDNAMGINLSDVFQNIGKSMTVVGDGFDIDGTRMADLALVMTKWQTVEQGEIDMDVPVAVFNVADLFALIRLLAEDRTKLMARNAPYKNGLILHDAVEGVARINSAALVDLNVPDVGDEPDDDHQVLWRKGVSSLDGDVEEVIILKGDYTINKNWGERE